jgi:hypothetical protein
MVSAIEHQNTAAAAPAERAIIVGSSSQSLYRRGRLYVLRFSAPNERECELTAREAFNWGEWCGAFLPFAEFTREDLVREMFPHHWRQFLKGTKGGSR